MRYTFTERARTPDPEWLPRALELYSNGKTYAYIINHLGLDVSQERLQYYIRRSGEQRGIKEAKRVQRIRMAPEVLVSDRDSPRIFTPSKYPIGSEEWERDPQTIRGNERFERKRQLLDQISAEELREAREKYGD